MSPSKLAVIYPPRHYTMTPTLTELPAWKRWIARHLFKWPCHQSVPVICPFTHNPCLPHGGIEHQELKQTYQRLKAVTR